MEIDSRSRVINRDPVIYVMLHNIRSLYNVGSLMRTCDGAGVQQVFLTGYTGSPSPKEMRKTALGAEQTVPWQHEWEALPRLAQLKAAGVMIVAVERTEGSQHYLEIPYRYPVCLIFGNEVTGLEPEILAEADCIAHVPMLGCKESLNVAVCGGIVLYGLLALQ